MFLVLPLLVVACIHTQGNAEVLLKTFKHSKCSHFFFNGQPPKGLVPQKAARICQLYERKYRFATMYDREKHIPIYSAYIYKQPIGEWVMRPNNDWFIEPQLVNQQESKEMMQEIDSNIPREQLKNSQATTNDYSDTTDKYNRGHLNPSLHHQNLNNSTATFTLTNIVPQKKTLNQGTWLEYERSMRTRSTNCAETYAIVGVVPGKHFIPCDDAKRVNIPSHIWAAACCKLIGTKTTRSWAVIADNSENAVQDISVGELEKKIHSLTKRGVHLFHKDCPK